MHDPFDSMYQSFQLFGSCPSGDPIHMSAGVNWNTAADEIIDLLKFELEAALSYRNYGRSSGGKIVTDILTATERRLAGSQQRIEAAVTNGTCDAAHIVTSLLLEDGRLKSGDCCLALGHCFPYYHNLFQGMGIDYQECIDDDCLFPGMAQIKSDLQRHKPSVVVFMLPHNPSGQILPAEAYREILEMAKAAGAVVFLDRVCMMAWDYKPSLMSAFYEPIADGDLYVFDSLAKSDSLAGLRTGYLLCACQELPHIEKAIRYRTLNPVVFSTMTLSFARLATLAIARGKGEIQIFERLIRRYAGGLFADYPFDFRHGLNHAELPRRLENFVAQQEDLRMRIQRNFQSLQNAFSKIAIKPLVLDGGFNVLLETSNMKKCREITDQKRLCHDSGVAVLTERCFRATPGDRDTYFLRLGLSLPTEEFSRGLDKLQEYYSGLSANH